MVYLLFFIILFEGFYGNEIFEEIKKLPKNSLSQSEQSSGVLREFFRKQIGNFALFVWVTLNASELAGY